MSASDPLPPAQAQRLVRLLLTAIGLFVAGVLLKPLALGLPFMLLGVGLAALAVVTHYWSDTVTGCRALCRVLAGPEHRWQTMTTLGAICTVVLWNLPHSTATVPQRVPKALAASGQPAPVPAKTLVRVQTKVQTKVKVKTIVKVKIPATLRAALLHNGVSGAQAIATMDITRAFNAFCLPYAKQAATLVQDAAHHHVDPAIVAGLFMHEDGNACTHPNSLIVADHNPGNMRCTDPSWGCTDGFQNYPTWEAGIDGWFVLYDNYVYVSGLHDWYSFIRKYCPSGVDGNGPVGLYKGSVMTFARQIRNGW